ncbi:MAG: cysteine hydrolase [Chloroflexi bacterium]|nr:cysteine hydrolase [Chloroflexota bacterium]
MGILEEKVNPVHTVLIVVDVQNDFCHPEGTFARAGHDLGMIGEIMPPLVALIEKARRWGVPIIYTQTFHSLWTDSPLWKERFEKTGVEGEKHCRDGTWGADFYQVSPLPQERVVIKHRYSAFYGTDLEVILKSREIKTVIMTGVATNVCVETTARDAYMRDYQVVFIEDCTAAYVRQEHQATLVNMQKFFGTVTASSEVIQAWEKKAGL